MMVILLVHNYYKQPGGEDVVMRSERELLESHGHRVDLIEADNKEIAGVAGKVRVALGTIYSPAAKERIAARIAELRPDIVHVHNFFPLLSPSIYYACREAGVPVAQSLHNYRLICPKAQLFREGRVCKDCVGKAVSWPGLLHACYQDSRPGSAVVAGMIAFHRQIGTWEHAVDVFIAGTDFSRNVLIEGGLPARKIVVKPNFVADPGSPFGRRAGPGRFALFVGRLSSEKGITTLLSSWGRLGSAIPLKVVGDGPLREDVVQGASGGIEYLGGQPREKVMALMREAAFLVFPSVWYEAFPMVIVEAFSIGLPVIASNLGSMTSLIDDGRTGLHFQPGDAADLAAKIEWALTHPARIAQMGQKARDEYLSKYTPERNYQMLMEIYARASGCKQVSETAFAHVT